MPTLLLYLDDDTLGDPLFASSLARMMGRRPVLPPCLVVHGSGEQAERALEGAGYFPEQRAGVWAVETDEEVALVEQGVRRLNRKLVNTLTDEGVPAVGLMAADRGLLRHEEGTVRAGRTAWLAELVRQRAVPVVAPLLRAGAGVEGGEALREVPLQALALALAEGLAASADELLHVFFGRREISPQPEARLPDVPPEALPARHVVEAVLGAGHTVYLTTPAGLFGGEGARGTRITSSESP